MSGRPAKGRAGSAHREADAVDHAAAGIDERQHVRAGARQDLLARIGVAERGLVKEQAIARNLAADRDREPLNATLRKLRAGMFPELTGNANVQRVLEFLDRRNLGRHGRYLESLRAG